MTSLQIHGACPHDCPDTCGMITTVENGRAVRVEADPDHPLTQGWLCAKVRPYLNHVYHPDRVLHPLKRVGAKGAGQWQRISWDEALDEIVSRWRQIISDFGPEAILPYSYSGTLGLVQMTVASARLWNRLGASQLHRSICGAAAECAVEATLGARFSASYADVLNSKLVLLWGTNPASTGPHFMPFLKQAQKRGCQVVVIDPKRTLSAQGADWHLAPWPGTDGILALGLGHLLVRDNLHDEGWLSEHTVGWPELRARLAEFPPDRVARETGVSEADLVKLAHLYGNTKPSLLKIADGINRNRNGGQNVRALLTLPALTGQYGQPGGGLAYSTSGIIKWDKHALHHWDECPKPGRVVNMNRLGAALCGEAQQPPIQALFVFGANPVSASPNAGKIVAGLCRPDLFTVVHELFLTDTADYADLVLPATSQLEQTDLHKAYGQTFLTYNHPAIEPIGECKSNWDLMRLLAERLGFREPWLSQSADEVIEEMLTATAAHTPALQGITLTQLKSGGAVPLRVESPPWQGGKFMTRSGKVELYSQSLASLGHDPLPGRFVPLAETTPAPDELWLITGASHHFVSSSFAGQPDLLAGEGEPFVEIHPEDAQQRGIATGQQVVLENSRGKCQLKAIVTDAVRPGVLASPKGRWAKLSQGSSVAFTTPDGLADFAGQSTYHSNLVRIRAAN